MERQNKIYGIQTMRDQKVTKAIICFGSLQEVAREKTNLLQETKGYETEFFFKS
jgi:hypothetical protein